MYRLVTGFVAHLMQKQEVRPAPSPVLFALVPQLTLDLASLAAHSTRSSSWASTTRARRPSLVRSAPPSYRRPPRDAR